VTLGREMFINITSKRLLWALACSLLACISSCTEMRSHPSARSLAIAHLTSQGGVDRLSALRGVERNGRITFYAGSQPKLATYRTCVLYPDSGAVQITGDSFQLSEVIKRGEAYICKSGFDNCQRAVSEKTNELRRTAREADRELLFELERWQLDANVDEELGYFRVSVTDSEIGPITYWFEKDSHLLVKKQRDKRVRTYGDWRTVEGFFFPYLIEDSEDGRQLLKIQLREVLLPKSGGSSWCSSLLESVIMAE
jgi:hypothetical protein